MAKKRKKVNQSKRIRDYWEKHPDAESGEVAKALGVAPHSVYNVRSQMKREGTFKKKARRKKKASARSIPKTSSNGSWAATAGDDSPHVYAAHLIRSCGSVEKAEQVLRDAAAVASVLA